MDIESSARHISGGLVAVQMPRDTFIQSSAGACVRTVSVNLKSAKSPADNGETNFAH